METQFTSRSSENRDFVFFLYLWQRFFGYTASNTKGNPAAGNLLQLAFAAALFVLGVIVAALGIKRLAEKEPAKA